MSDSRPVRIQRSTRRRCRGEEGQALVEFALVLPLVALIVGVAFNGWNGIQESIRLTGAARAGALVAASDLGNTTTPMGPQDVLAAATTAINAEEDTNVFQSDDPGANDYVSMVTSTQSVPMDQGNAAVSMNVVTITIHESQLDLVPFVGSLPVTAHATARYS